MDLHCSHYKIAISPGSSSYNKILVRDRRITLYSWLQEGTGKKQEEVPDWLDGDIIDTHSLGTTTTTAQVMKWAFRMNVVL